MSGRVSFEGRVAWSVAIGAVMAMLALPDPALAQSEPAARGPAGGPPQLNRAGKVPGVQAPSRRRPADLLDIRDRLEGAEATVQVVPIMATSPSALCVAGCGDATAKAVGSPAPKPTEFLAAMGPVEVAAPQAVKLAAAPTVVMPAVPVAVANPTNVVVCLAGCYDTDRRTLLATGGPLPTPAVPFRNMLAAAAPMPIAKPPATRVVNWAAPSQPVAAKPMTTAAVKLKRSFAAHVMRRETRSKVASRQHHRKVAMKSPPKQMIATVGAPTPVPSTPVPQTLVQPAPPAAPFASAAKVQPVAAQKKPVVVKASNDWFNKITREQAAKKAADAAKDD